MDFLNTIKKDKNLRKILTDNNESSNKFMMKLKMKASVSWHAAADTAFTWEINLPPPPEVAPANPPAKSKGDKK